MASAVIPIAHLLSNIAEHDGRKGNSHKTGTMSSSITTCTDSIYLLQVMFFQQSRCCQECRWQCGDVRLQESHVCQIDVVVIILKDCLGAWMVECAIGILGDMSSASVKGLHKVTPESRGPGRTSRRTDLLFRPGENDKSL